jgi:hypothetical protein
VKSKVLGSLTALILIILPFLLGILLGKHSPYLETNSFSTYLIIWTVISVVLASGAALLLKANSKPLSLTLFLLVCPIVGIIGFAAPPDLSLKMLEHPELEHLRYIFLFIAAILFGVFGLLLFRSNTLKIGKSTKVLMIVLFALAFSEFIWEFTHHYFYPEALKEWVNQGKNAEEFGKNYDTVNFINIGVLGRIIQFSLVIWLSLYLYKLRQIKIWSPIISFIFALLGIVSAIVVFITQMNIPKGFEVLFLFFIPGMPFLLLYWLGVAIMTKTKKSERVSQSQ